MEQPQLLDYVRVKYSEPVKEVNSEELKERANNLIKKKSALLGIESHVKERLTGDINTFLHEANGWKEIDMSFLRMRDKNGLPRFAIFTPDSPTCKITASLTYQINTRDFMSGVRSGLGFMSSKKNSEATMDIKPKIETSWNINERGRYQYYDYMFNDLVKKCQRLEENPQELINKSRYQTMTGLSHRFEEIEMYAIHSKYNIQQEFVDIIPDDVRDNIIKAKEYFDAIFIVKEADTWKESHSIEKEKMFIDRDPLVIGHKAGKDYLIDQFNTVNLEDFVSNEFTTNENKGHKQVTDARAAEQLINEFEAKNPPTLGQKGIKFETFKIPVMINNGILEYNPEPTPEQSTHPDPEHEVDVDRVETEKFAKLVEGKGKKPKKKFWGLPKGW